MKVYSLDVLKNRQVGFTWNKKLIISYLFFFLSHTLSCAPRRILIQYADNMDEIIHEYYNNN